MKYLYQILNEPAGLRYYGGALFYALFAYGVGFAGIFHENLFVNLFATLILAHSMVIAAYLVHECGHNLLFRKIQHNTNLGRILTWFCGASYGTYEDIRYKHFRHHVDNDDVVWFDYERFFVEHPLILKVTRFLEWFYIPAHDLIMHFIMIFSSFIIPQRFKQRRRNVTVIFIRGGIFIALMVWVPKVAVLYAVAYMLMMTVLRFMDSIQHDYSYHLNLFEGPKSVHKGDEAWEQEHTFSNPLAFNNETVNRLTLNFGFHNAHHADMNTPWYKLPMKHRELFGNNPEKVVPFSSQLKIFHKQRVRRICDNHDENAPSGHDFLIAARKAEVYGGNAASFLTSF
jgi:omega-6 fatty acid desaturase (delta-12 desaturase)